MYHTDQYCHVGKGRFCYEWWFCFECLLKGILHLEYYNLQIVICSGMVPRARNWSRGGKLLQWQLKKQHQNPVAGRDQEYLREAAFQHIALRFIRSCGFIYCQKKQEILGLHVHCLFQWKVSQYSCTAKLFHQ